PLEPRAAEELPRIHHLRVRLDERGEGALGGGEVLVVELLETGLELRQLAEMTARIGQRAAERRRRAEVAERGHRALRLLVDRGGRAQRHRELRDRRSPGDEEPPL